MIHKYGIVRPSLNAPRMTTRGKVRQRVPALEILRPLVSRVHSAHAFAPIPTDMTSAMLRDPISRLCVDYLL